MQKPHRFHFITKQALLITALWTTQFQPAQARPLSYPDGTMVMLHNSGSEHGIELNYTLTPHWGIGLHSLYNSQENYQNHSVQINNLLWRGNFPDSQANIFTMTGFGYAQTDGADETAPSAYTGIEADWEDRRFYILYENRYFHAEDINKEYTQKLRLGMAPYIAEAGNLHTWAILQIDHTPRQKDHITLTPTIRLFKDTNLIEAGISNQGDITFNWTHQF